MARQPDLFERQRLVVQPRAGQVQNRLWVRRLTIWSEAGQVIRSTALRPGLNIVWSPDPADQAATLTASGNASALGHGSGKTLFCRLLRYCLGEERFAPDEQRRAIAQAFPQGWVSAEVMLDGRLWAVLRPLGLARGHLAVPDVPPEQLFDRLGAPTGIEPLLAAIENTILTPAVAALVPADQPLNAWRVALAWLTRDQECRFNHVLDWRSPESDSGSPTRAMSGVRLQDSLRALIGAIVADEIQLRTDIAAFEDLHKTLTLRLDRQRWACDQSRDDIAAVAGLARGAVPAGRLCIEVLRDAAKRTLAHAARLNTAVDVNDLTTLRTQLESARQAVSDLEKKQAVAQEKLPIIDQLLQRMRSELPISSAQVRGAEVPVCLLCEVPIDRVLAEGCKLSDKLPDLEALRARHLMLVNEIQQQESARASANANAAHADAGLPAQRATVDALRRQVHAVEKLTEGRSGSWFKLRRALDDVKRLNEGLIALELTTDDLADLTRKLDDKRAQTGAFRDAQRAVFDRLSTLFDGVIQTMVGPAATGRVTLDGQGLKLRVDLGGERSTAAIESLKVIAFDIAVMCMSMEGATHLPAFLVHDSPREADLGLSVYHRLFTMVAGLEQTHASTFQYIVTTTTQPPAELQTRPWLCETLRGMPAQERLLRRDLT